MQKEISTRVYGRPMQINTEKVKNLYSDRVNTRSREHVDAPVVLSSDVDADNIRRWTEEELRRWFPQFSLHRHCRVLEIGFGTGRMTKYITQTAEEYVGIDYVPAFRDIVLQREDIVKKENTQFFTVSLEEFLDGRDTFDQGTFNRVFLSGGVLMYINDESVQSSMANLTELLCDDCIIYISEPVALEERLTLNEFYSDNIRADYSAIYRTEAEYQRLFQPLFDCGFKLKISREFFEHDIKKMKETKQWIFLLQRETAENTDRGKEESR